MSGTKYNSDPAVQTFNFVVGRNIRRLRIERGYSLRGLARLAGVKYRTIDSAEEGAAASFFTMTRLSAALRAPMAEFVAPLGPKAVNEP